MFATDQLWIAIQVTKNIGEVVDAFGPFNTAEEVANWAGKPKGCNFVVRQLSHPDTFPTEEH